MNLLAPIKFPELRKLTTADKDACRPEAWTSAMMILAHKTGQEYWYQPDDMAIYIWEPQEDRLWILGFTSSVVCYFSFETGNPFCWHVESLLKKSRTESWDWAKTLFHVQTSINYPIPAGNDVLPEKDGLPLILWEMEERKILGSGARKILRNYYCQLKFTPLGFPEATRTRAEVLSVVVSSTVNTTIEQIIKVHPQIYQMLMVPQEKEYAEKKELEEEGSVEEPKEGCAGVENLLIQDGPAIKAFCDSRRAKEPSPFSPILTQETRQEGASVAEDQEGTQREVS